MKNSLPHELDLLLAESPAAARQREAAAFDELAGPAADSLVLFGAGGLGRKTLKGLRQAGLEPLAFADNDPGQWHRQIEGMDILPPEEAARRFGRTAAFVVTIWRAGGGHRFDRTRAQLQQLGCERVIPAMMLFWKYPEIFLDYYCLGLPSKLLAERDAIRQAFGWLADEASQREYVSQIRWRLWADFAGLASPVEQEQYFPDDLFSFPGADVFVDCGAFDGDSLDAFVRRQGAACERVVALEPDPANFKKMSDRVAAYPEELRRKIRLEPVGAADFNGTLRFDAGGGLSSAANPNGSLQINCVKLDELLRGARPTYLKMDIEGAEPEALKGAAQTIRDAAPVLAVSAYHKPDHLWRLPELIRSLRPDYRLYLRPHNEECWDTVCYAVPPGRSNPTADRTMKPNLEKEFAPRGCEVCGGNRPRLLYAQRFVPMSEGSLLTGYNVVACGDCGFCYADHLPAQEVFDRYYRDMSKYEQPIGEVKPSEYDVERFRLTVEKIRGFMPDRQARIVEIGCATGLLLSQLKQAGFSGVAGLDPSPACCQVASEQYRVPVKCGALSDDLVPAGSVDLLILIGVMEHIRDLEAALKKMVAMLAPGGRMFITVPDASQYAAGDDAPYQEFSLEHINYFGPKSLANLMARYGFRYLFTEQAMQRCNVRTVTPVVHAAFEKLPAGEIQQWNKDDSTVRGLERYVAKSKSDNDAVQGILNGLATSRQPVIIWGAGSHTLRLLATSRLSEANLAAIVDSNPRYQGKNVNGVPILSPDAIRGTDASILISSRVFQQNIRSQIKEHLRLKNEVVTLYQVD